MSAPAFKRLSNPCCGDMECYGHDHLEDSHYRNHFRCFVHERTWSVVHEDYVPFEMTLTRWLALPVSEGAA